MSLVSDASFPPLFLTLLSNYFMLACMKVEGKNLIIMSQTKLLKKLRGNFKWLGKRLVFHWEYVEGGKKSKREFEGSPDGIVAGPSFSYVDVLVSEDDDYCLRQLITFLLSRMLRDSLLLWPRPICL